MSSAAKMVMMAMTTKSSISVKPDTGRGVFFHPLNEHRISFCSAFMNLPPSIDRFDSIADLKFLENGVLMVMHRRDTYPKRVSEFLVEQTSRETTHHFILPLR